MNWKKEHHAEQSFNERHPQFENQTSLMKNIVQTESGEIVEIINGTLICLNKTHNLETIVDWLAAEDTHFDASINMISGQILVDFDDEVPVSKMESLLEHFTYQK